MIEQERELIRSGVPMSRARAAVRAGRVGFTAEQASLIDADMATVH